MPGEVDARLIGLLQGAGPGGLAARCRNHGDITVRLGREDGLMLLKLVAGANDADGGSLSQRGRPARQGAHSLRISNLTFDGPSDERRHGDRRSLPAAGCRQPRERLPG